MPGSSKSGAASPTAGPAIGPTLATGLRPLDLRLLDDDRLFRFFGRRAEGADPFDDVHALADLADQGIFGRQPGVGPGHHVELAARAPRRLRRALRHRDDPLRVG